MTIVRPSGSTTSLRRWIGLVTDALNSGGGGGGGTPDWADITGKPSTFTPSTHSHEISDTTGLQTALNGKATVTWSTITASLGDGRGVYEYVGSFNDAAVTASSVVELRLGTTADTDENEPEMMGVLAMGVKPANGSFELTLAFGEPHSGPVKMQYRVN